MQLLLAFSLFLEILPPIQQVVVSNECVCIYVAFKQAAILLIKVAIINFRCFERGHPPYEHKSSAIAKSLWHLKAKFKFQTRFQIAYY